MSPSERAECVLNLWDAQKTAPEIAVAFGTKTYGWVQRVIAAARTAGDPRAARRQAKPLQPRSPLARTRGQDASIARRLAAAARRAAEPSSAADAPSVEIAAPTRADAYKALAGTKPITIMELALTTCRWPIGDAPTLYCGCPCPPAGVYCATHAEMGTGRSVPVQARVHRKMSSRPKISRSFIAEDVA